MELEPIEKEKDKTVYMDLKLKGTKGIIIYSIAWICFILFIFTSVPSMYNWITSPGVNDMCFEKYGSNDLIEVIGSNSDLLYIKKNDNNYYWIEERWVENCMSKKAYIKIIHSVDREEKVGSVK